MAVGARIERPHTKDRRGRGRRKLNLNSTSKTSGDEVLVHDISTTGMLLATSAKFEPFEEIEVELPHAGVVKARVVRTTSGLFGCQFLEPISKAAVSAALLRSPASPERQPLASSAPPRSAMARGEFSFGTKLGLIIGISLLLWTLLIAAASVAWQSL
jgi:hypothetical protein